MLLTVIWHVDLRACNEACMHIKSEFVPCSSLCTLQMGLNGEME
jgi:hypothetical protein